MYLYVYTSGMKTTTIRVGLPNALYISLRSIAKKTSSSVAGLAREGIQKEVEILKSRSALSFGVCRPRRKRRRT